MLAFWTPGPAELVVIGLVVAVLFAGRLPKVMRSLGQSLVELRKGLREARNLELEEKDDV